MGCGCDETKEIKKVELPTKPTKVTRLDQVTQQFEIATGNLLQIMLGVRETTIKVDGKGSADEDLQKHIVAFAENTKKTNELCIVDRLGYYLRLLNFVKEVVEKDIARI